MCLRNNLSKIYLFKIKNSQTPTPNPYWVPRLSSLGSISGLPSPILCSGSLRDTPFWRDTGGHWKTDLPGEVYQPNGCCHRSGRPAAEASPPAALGPPPRKAFTLTSLLPPVELHDPGQRHAAALHWLLGAPRAPRHPGQRPHFLGEYKATADGPLPHSLAPSSPRPPLRLMVGHQQDLLPLASGSCVSCSLYLNGSAPRYPS